MDRIKTAYIKGIMKIEDFDKEIRHIDYRKLELEKQIENQSYLRVEYKSYEK